MALTERAFQDHPTLHMATLCEAFQWTAAQRPDAVALRTYGTDTAITWAEYAQRVQRLAGGFAALGVRPGDTVAMLMLNRAEFNVVDTALLHLGATPFSIYNTSSRGQVEYLFDNAGNRFCVTQPELAAAAEGQCERVIDVAELAEIEALEPPADFDFEASWRAVAPETIATLIYTSGTTGPPKGVQLTHANLMAELRGCSTVLPVEPGGRTTSFLPSAHIADRWASHYYASIAFGSEVTSVPDPKQVIGALTEVKPTAWGAVPRVWEKIEAALRAQGITDPDALPEEVKAGVRAKLGLDECRWFISGAAPIAPETLRFFLALGIPIQELWGMSETSCCVTINPADDIRIGTCGPPVPGVELRIADDGELLVKGDLVMAGYRGAPEQTAEAIDPDGWLHTGDVAELDADGYMTIVDRKKELIINAAGKNMSPANIEAKLKASHPLIGQAVVIGDRRPYVVALLVLDPDVAAAKGASTADLAANPDVVAELDAAVEAANVDLSRVEQVKRFTVLGDEWLPGGDELTPTMKLKRKPIGAKYETQIEALYG